MTLIFGSLEICHRMMLKQTATVAAYETARSAARRGITTDQAAARARIMAQRGIENSEVTFDPAEISQLASGDMFRVRVRVPINGNTPVNYVLPMNGRIQVNAFMLRE